jgi:hypothetical protein
VGYHEWVKKLGRVEASVESLDARLEEMERKMDRLRVLYENFFMGVDRTPPNVPRRDMNRLVLDMQQTPIKNATMRFRFQTLLQRWVLLTTYWNRTLREIETGTYRRDLVKAHRHMAARGGAITEEEALRLGIPASRVKSFVSRQNKQSPAAGNEATPAPAPASQPAPPPQPAPASQPAPPPLPQARAAARAAEALVPGLASGELEDFYRRFVKAHTETAGAPPRASLAQMRAKLQQDLPRIMAMEGCLRVRLDIAVEAGKVKLRVRPVK